MTEYPPLKSLHPASALSKVKLAELGRLETEVLKKTLLPGEKHSLKVRPDGTILDGHHRIEILRTRGVEVDSLPREIISKTSENNSTPREDRE